jgi:phytoene dehydrogenase-like protein
MDHETARRMGVSGQREYLDMLLDEKWWQDGISEFRVLSKRVPVEWGTEYSLARDAMNPVMTAEFMRQGRLPHRSPDLRGLYLAGSATHPGQWVSFCAISGVLAADCAREDFA